MEPEDGTRGQREEGTKTEPDQHNHRGQDGEKTMQIKGDVRRGGRGGMAMPLVGCGCLADAIGVDQAHRRGHGHETRNQGNEYLPGLGGRRHSHGGLTLSATSILRSHAPLL